MRIGEVLLREFSGGRAPRHQVANVPDALRVLLVEAGGSVRALARMIGRPRRTVRDWLAGTTPRGGGRFLVDNAVRAQRRNWLPTELEDELRHGFDETIVVDGVLEISDPEPRHLELAYTPGYGDRLVDAYLDGADADQLEAIFVDGIVDDWYREHVGNPDQWDTKRIDPWGAR